MRLLIDTNILIDVLQNRRAHVKKSLEIWRLCESGRHQGFVSAFSILDIVYILRSELSPEKTADILGKLERIFSIESLRAADLSDAAALGWKDYEDAVQSSIAKRIGANYIVTRNTKDYGKSSVEAIAPAEFLKLRA